MNEEKVQKIIENFAEIGFFFVTVLAPIFAALTLVGVSFLASYINGSTLFQVLTN